MSYIYIFLTIILTVYGQLVIKWQVKSAGAFPVDITGKVFYLLHLLTNPWIISGLAAAFLAALSWMAAMTRFDLSYAYPFISLSFVLVLAFSAVFFQEAITTFKLIGLLLIVTGIIVGSQG